MPNPRVTRTDLHPDSALNGLFKEDDFLDCYSVDAEATPRHAAEIITSFPGWAQALVGLRNIVVGPFGLSTDGPQADDKLGAFPVISETDREIIAGFDDKHLDFRVSVFSDNGQVSLATWVRRHNFAGHAYLAAIMPFHVLIARDAVARVAMDNGLHQKAA